jgi:hypothetical protein
MNAWHELAALHSPRHRMSDGLFVEGPCAYCGLTTIDFCPECGIFVCRRCDTPRHWPAVGIFPDIGFTIVYSGHERRSRK